MAKKKPTQKSPSSARREQSVRELGAETLAAIQTLLTIEGVVGIGQPVTLLSPADLPLDFLAFVERLRCGPVELDEEMLLITLFGSRSGRRKKDPVRERLREALILLCRYATDNGVSTGDVLSQLDETKRQLSRLAKSPKDQE